VKFFNRLITLCVGFRQWCLLILPLPFKTTYSYTYLYQYRYHIRQKNFARKKKYFVIFKTFTTSVGCFKTNERYLINISLNFFIIIRKLTVLIDMADSIIHGVCVIKYLLLLLLLFSTKEQ